MDLARFLVGTKSPDVDSYNPTSSSEVGFGKVTPKTIAPTAWVRISLLMVFPLPRFPGIPRFSLSAFSLPIYLF